MYAFPLNYHTTFAQTEKSITVCVCACSVSAACANRTPTARCHDDCSRVVERLQVHFFPRLLWMVSHLCADLYILIFNSSFKAAGILTGIVWKLQKTLEGTRA